MPHSLCFYFPPQGQEVFLFQSLLLSNLSSAPLTGRTRDLCTKYDILYVSDEVVTGFGRIGHIFSSETEFGIRPDMIISAKGSSLVSLSPVFSL